MAAGGRVGGPALGVFLAALHDRTRDLSREDLLAVLVGHAERLPVPQRRAFLDIFPDPAAAPAPPLAASTADLLAGIDAFAARVAAGEYADDEGSRWDGYRWADEEAATWALDADALFAAVGEVFLAGDLQAARAAYERLLAPFGVGGGDGWSLELWELESTEVPETLARYLRCIFETTAADARAAAVHRAWLDLPSHWTLTLAELSGTRREQLPGLDAFLPGWIECLLTETGHPPLPQRVRLLTEAATLAGGVDALANMARRPGTHQGGVGLAWVDSLNADGRQEEARAAARETLDLPGVDARHRAEAADRLADLGADLGDPVAAVEARRRAWTSGPTRRRLLAMAATSQEAGVLPETLAAEADALTVTKSAGRGTGRLRCELLLLAGRVDEASAALTAADPLGWHHADHPGPVVLPVLWAAALGAAPAPDAGHLGALFAGIDLDPAVLPRLEDWPPTRQPSARPELAGVTLTGLLADAIRAMAADAGRREAWLSAAAAVTDARITAIVSGKHRSAYARAASLAHAHAETLAGLGQVPQAHAYLAAVRTRFPRHVAFRGELDAAATASTLRNRRT